MLEWVNHVDLMRVHGVGPQYADVLEAAGVDSPLELAHRNAANLARTFAEVDAARPDMIRRVPSEEMVAGWIEQAKGMQRAVFHEDGGATPSPSSADEPVAEPAAPSPGQEPEPAARAEPGPPVRSPAPAAPRPEAHRVERPREAAGPLGPHQARDRYRRLTGPATDWLT